MCRSCGFPDLQHGTKLRRRDFVFAATLAAGFQAAGGAAFAQAANPAPPKPQNVMTPDAALARLIEGNRRYQTGASKRHDFVAEREALVGGQNPYAAILSCADSRIAPEYAFDSARGDLFVCRVAGNLLNPENIASFEYAVEALKTPLLLVLGHERCGAVSATISSLAENRTLPGHLPSLVTALTPAVKAVAGKPGDALDNATRENVRLAVAALAGASPLISAAVGEKRVRVVGGIYRLADGKVDIFA